MDLGFCTVRVKGCVAGLVEACGGIEGGTQAKRDLMGWPADALPASGTAGLGPMRSAWGAGVGVSNRLLACGALGKRKDAIHQLTPKATAMPSTLAGTQSHGERLIL